MNFLKRTEEEWSFFEYFYSDKYMENRTETSRNFRIVRLSPDGNDNIRRFHNNCVTTCKYNALTFLPLFFYQFLRKFTNAFFCVIAALQQIPRLSADGPYAVLLPLSFITVMEAVKELYEDVRRNRADRTINNKQVERLEKPRGGEESVFRWTAWKNINVGDIVRVNNGDYFPADLMLLSTSQSDLLCCLETSNLDGETSLKFREAHPTLQELLPQQLLRMRATVHCSPPGPDLYVFEAQLRRDGEKDVVLLGADQFLQRGARLQNTDWIIGLVVYTGHQTRLCCNTTVEPTLKRSRMECAMNERMMYMFFFFGFLVLVFTVINVCFHHSTAVNHWYLGRNQLNINFVSLVTSLMTYVLLLYNYIPISLNVSVEVLRIAHSLLLSSDIEMYHEPNDTPVTVKTSSLNEDLGQVRYLFSDKTGTLTRNEMEFRKAFIGGRLYGSCDALDAVLQSDELLNASPILRTFMTAVCLCHQVIPQIGESSSRSGQVPIYRAASPDEKALVEQAARWRWIFSAKNGNVLTVTENGRKEQYTILDVLAFSSERMRMSVLARAPSGSILMLCKGADEVIFQRLAAGQDEAVHQTKEAVSAFASEGLRTLCFAFKVVSEETYTSWKSKLSDANNASLNSVRQDNIDSINSQLENDLTLIGVTGIEDRLQDGVEDTIDVLLAAGIRIWMLTGDKPETAINIAKSCRLLKPDTKILHLHTPVMSTIRKVIAKGMQQLIYVHNRGSGDSLAVGSGTEAAAETPETALLTNGETLARIWADDHLTSQLEQVCMKCSSVICCRVSPRQKAIMIEAVRRVTDKVTLAIGDGGNDVPMIRAAHVGVAIEGVEGKQAAASSDYAIGQFRFLRRLLLVHGANCYYRVSRMTLLFFYKNVLFSSMCLWFAMASGYSPQVFFEPWAAALYNALFTIVSAFTTGIIDRPCSDKLSYTNPQLYAESQSGRHFSLREFLNWTTRALLHSLALFLFCTTLLNSSGSRWHSGLDAGHHFNSFSIYTYMLVVVDAKTALETKTWNWIAVVGLSMSVIFWHSFMIIYCYLVVGFSINLTLAKVYYMMISSPVFWCGLLLVPVSTIMIDLTLKTLSISIRPSLTVRCRNSHARQKAAAAIIGKAGV